MTKAKKSAADQPPEEQSFEQSLERLQEIVEELEGGEAPLERALELFEEGVVLGRRCGSRLDVAEKRITMLVEREDGGQSEEEFDAEAASAPARRPAPARRAAPRTREAGSSSTSAAADDETPRRGGQDDIPF